MKTKNLRLFSLVIAVAAVTLFALAFSPNTGYTNPEAAIIKMDCPNGFYVTVNGGTYPFRVTVQGISGQYCDVFQADTPCCFSMQGQNAGKYLVMATNGQCSGSTQAVWPGSGLVPVTVNAYDCNK